MYAKRYFGGRYFGGRYFGTGFGNVPVTIEDVYNLLLELQANIRSQGYRREKITREELMRETKRVLNELREFRRDLNKSKLGERY